MTKKISFTGKQPKKRKKQEYRDIELVAQLLEDIDTEFFGLEEDYEKVAWMSGFRFAMKWKSRTSKKDEIL